MAIELFKDKQGWNIRKGLMRNNCCCSDITEKELILLADKIYKKFKTNGKTKTN